MAEQTKSQKIIELCELHWAAHQKDCSGFVKAVAADLGIHLSGLANSIVDQIQTLPWRVLDSGEAAQREAVKGNLVIGGLKADNHGHVVIVVPGVLAHHKYPRAYWGSLAGVGKKNETINWSWNKTDRDKVIYGCIAI